MRASTASAYVDEPSVRAFLRKVGTEYPAPVAGKGRSRKWDRDHLDKYPTTRPRPGPVPRRRLVMGWPRYMVEKRLAGGAVAHYWRPLASDLKGGFTLTPRNSVRNLPPPRHAPTSSTNTSTIGVLARTGRAT